MSYQGFNWSPYFDHVPDHQRRNQPSEVNESYQRHSYQPPATHTPSVTNAPSQLYSSAQSSTERNSNSHSSRYAPGGLTNSSSESTRNMSQDYFDSRRLPPYSAAQTSTSTTAMGNLVFASSLAQEQRTDTAPPRYGSMQHIVDYNRYSQPTTSSTTPAVYGMTSTASNGYEQRSDSRGSGIAREEYRPPDSRNNYSASNTNAKTQLDGEKYNQSHPRPSSRGNSKVSQFSSTSRQSDSTSTAHSKRLPSAKQTKAVPSRPLSVSNQSVDRGALPSSMQNASAVRRVSKPRQTAGESSHVELSHVESSTPHHQVAPTSNHHVSQNRSATSEQTSYPLPRSLPYQPQEVQPHENQAHESRPSNNRNAADSPRETEAQNQTTVDPSHIFNHYEFQKRQAAAEASRKVAEEAATKNTKSAHVAAPAPAPAPARVPTPVAAASAGETPAAGRKNQMELEMMQMIEKMRDYKAKDPALFSQIWEQVKKGQPANQTQPANRSVSQASASISNNKENSIAEITESVPLLSPTPAPAELPLEPEASVGSREKAPDLGKFPFHRRKSRKSTVAATDSNVPSTTSSGSISSGNTSITSGNTVLPSGNNPITNGNSFLSAGNNLSKNAHNNASPNIGSAGPTTAAAAIKDSNQNTISQPQQGRLPPQIVHVRGVGPQIPQEPTPPQDPSKKGTIWPQGNHKWALAEAARRALTSGSVNAGRAISVNEIVMILDQNPSYTELCEKLELRGFIIDRGHFARLLLSAVSNTAEADPGPGPRVSNPPNQQYAQPQMKNNGFNQWQRQGIVHPTNVAPNQQYSGFGMLMKTPAIRSHGLPSASEVISRSSTRNRQMPFSHEHLFALNTPLLVPSNKKEMAKKRTFAEIIDLTQHVSDDDENINSENSVKPTKNSHSHLRPEMNSAPMTDEENMDHSKFKYALSQRDLLHSETIIRPMNKRHDALRRDNYNAKTIARDILVASGKHPFMVPLNFHLDILRKKFRHVDNNSDLTTFKWDLVDPGPPKITDDTVNDADDEGGALNVVNSDGQQVRIAAATDDDDVIMIDANIRQPIKSFPLLGKFKVSRYEGQSEGEMSFQRTPIDASYHNIPNFPELLTPSKRRGRPPGSGKKPRDERNQASASSQPRSQPLSQTPSQLASQTSAPPESQTSLQPESQTPSQPPGPRRRGRPPGSKNSGPRKSATKSPHINTSAGPPSSTGPLRQSGLRNSKTTTSDGFAVVIDSHHSAKKGTLELKKAKLIRRNDVVHKVYKCRWNDCPYELHNLQTLRKHVYKHREQYGNGPFPCCWADCGTINLSEENTDDNELIPLEFDTVSSWESHIDAKHLNIIAWDMGDGPSSSDVEASDYLSDAQGRQMTPVARTTGPSDPLGLTSEKEVAQQYHKVHGNRTDRDKAKTLFDSLKEKNDAQGGMARSGSRVITSDMADKVTARSGFTTVPPEEL